MAYLNLFQLSRAVAWYGWRIRPRIIWPDATKRRVWWNMAKWREVMKAK